MVYIAPLPQKSAKHPVSHGHQAGHPVRQQTDQQERPTGSLKTPAVAKYNNKATNQPFSATKKSGNAKSAVRKKQQPTPDCEPDPQRLLAHQAALATQVLQREQVALHALHSSSNGLLAGTPHQSAAAQAPAARAEGSEDQCWTKSMHWLEKSAANGPFALQSSPAVHQPQQRGQKEMQPLPRAHAATKRSQNHMFWDVAPKAINPAQVPGLTEQPAAGSGHPAAFYSSFSEPDGCAVQHQQQFHWQPQCYSQDQPSSYAVQQAVQLQQQQVAQTAAHAQHTTCTAADTSYAADHTRDCSHNLLPAPCSPALHAASWQGGGGSSCTGAPGVQLQQQFCMSTGSGDGMTVLLEALRAAEANKDPTIRFQMVKDIKQQIYKVELQQQIAERDAAKRATKAAAAAREAAEVAARAAAPLPWDPTARLARRGGGGEPLKGVDGAPVADLRNQRHMLPAPGLEPKTSQLSTTAARSPTQQQHQHQHAPLQQQQYPCLSQTPRSPNQHVSLQAAHSPGHTLGSTDSPRMVPPHVGLHAGLLQPAATTAEIPLTSAAAVHTAAGAKGFMSSLSELRPGPSQEQRAAAAVARQQLQRDLEAQVAEKAARAAAQAAAEAARMAAEEAKLQQYLLTKSSSQADVTAIGKEASMVYAAAGPLNAPAVPSALTARSNTGSGGMPLEQRRGGSKRVIDAPWLDQLKPQQQQQQQPDNVSALKEQQHVHQEISQLYVPHHHVVPRQHGQSDSDAGEALSQAAAARRSAGRLRAGERQQEGPSHHLEAAAAAGSSSSRLSNTGRPSVPPLPLTSRSLTASQLSAALQQVQQLQQEQLRMWEGLKQQAQDMQQMLQDRQAAAADRDAARSELNQLHELLQQHRQLHDTYNGQQQLLRTLEQQQQQPAAQLAPFRHTQQQLAAQYCGDITDCLDSLVVETQMVPISVSVIPEVIDDGVRGGDVACHHLHKGPEGYSPQAMQAHPHNHAVSMQFRATVPGPSARHHQSRYSSFYGLEAELSSASVASQASSLKGGRKTRVRGSTSNKAALAAAAAPCNNTKTSVSSSLAASSSFVPFRSEGPARHTGRHPHHPQEAAADTQQQLAAAAAAAAKAGVPLSPRSKHITQARRAAAAVSAATLAVAAAAAAGHTEGHMDASGIDVPTCAPGSSWDIEECSSSSPLAATQRVSTDAPSA